MVISAMQQPVESISPFRQHLDATGAETLIAFLAGRFHVKAPRLTKNKTRAENAGLEEKTRCTSNQPHLTARSIPVASVPAERLICWNCDSFDIKSQNAPKGEAEHSHRCNSCLATGAIEDFRGVESSRRHREPPEESMRTKLKSTATSTTPSVLLYSPFLAAERDTPADTLIDAVRHLKSADGADRDSPSWPTTRTSAAPAARVVENGETHDCPAADWNDSSAGQYAANVAKVM
jgi:hypothetical protein